MSAGDALEVARAPGKKAGGMKADLQSMFGSDPAAKLENRVAGLLEQENYMQALEALEASRVLLTIEGESFVPRAPEGILSPGLLQALREHNRQMLVVLRLAALAVNSTGGTRLHRAVQIGDLPEVRRLLANGARVDRQNVYGQTPLFLAVAHGQEEIVETLAIAGADPNLADVDGKTPLHKAVEQGNLRMAGFLLVNGSRVNQGDFFGLTPLCLAVARDNLAMQTLLGQFGAAIEDEESYTEKERNFFQLVLRILDAYGPELKQHSLRVADMARWIALRLELPEEEVKAVRLGGLLHDVGKVSLPDEIFDQADDEVAPEDAELLMTHAEDGYAALAADEYQVRWDYRPIILHHHERWDGTGFPRGIAGEEIPLGAQIVAVADYFDHLTTHRHYDPAVPPKDAVEQVKALAGSHFRPDLVQALADLQEELLVYTQRA